MNRRLRRGPRSLRLLWQPGLGLGVALLIVWTITGTGGFMWIEGWSFIDALYMTVITVSTVGYGEVLPLTSNGKLFATFLIVGGLGTAIYTFTRLGQVILDGELLGGLGRRRMRKELGGLRDHYIVCGFGRAARPVADGLAHKGLPFCVVEANRDQEPVLQDRDYVYLIDDATSDKALEDAGVHHAKAVLTLLPSDADNLYVTVTVKSLSPGIRVIARAVDERGEVKLRRAGADEVISPYELASHPILQAATSPTVLEFMRHVTDRNYLEMSLVEAIVSEGSKLSGRSLADARFRKEFGVTVVAIRRKLGQMVFNPEPAEILNSGDVVVLMGHSDRLFETQRALNA